MVALKNLMPEKPEDRNAVERILRESPDLARFLQRLSDHIRETYRDLAVHIDSRQYEPWEPLLTVVLKGPMTEQEFNERYDAIRAWAGNDPEYDPSRIHVSLRNKTILAHSR